MHAAERAMEAVSDIGTDFKQNPKWESVAKLAGLSSVALVLAKLYAPVLVSYRQSVNKSTSADAVAEAEIELLVSHEGKALSDVFAAAEALKEAAKAH